MLVDINLLPHKEKKSIQTTLFIIALAFLLISSATWIGIDYYTSSTQLREKEQVLQQEKKLVQIKQQKIKEANTVIGSEPLLEKVTYVQSKEVEAVNLLQHLVALLPQRGFFMKYDYKNKSTVEVEVRFDTLAETSEYLHQLTSSPYFTQASMEQLETTNFEEIEEGENLSDFNQKYLPRYHARYKIDFEKENLVDITGDTDVQP